MMMMVHPMVTATATAAIVSSVVDATTTASATTMGRVDTIVSSVVASAAGSIPTSGGSFGGTVADTVQAVVAAYEGNDSPSSSSSWVFPLVLSCMAGASTCLGAAVVFCFPPHTIKQTMPFSLSLAASVMITISAVSIAPECLEGVIVHQAQQQSSLSPYIINYALLLERMLSFGAGCAGYMMLSKMLEGLPDPEGMEFWGNEKNNSSKAATEHLIDDVENNECEEKASLFHSSEDGVGVDDHDTRSFVSHSAKIMPPSVTSRSSGTAQQRMNTTTSTMRVSSPSVDKNGKSNDVESTETYDNCKPTTTLLLSTTSETTATTSATTTTLTLRQEEQRRSWRVALLLFVSLLAHNFPEGLAVAASAQESPQLGVTVAIGILIHNVPEGIAISVPCMAARPDSPWLAFWLASISGLAEPIGALVALSVLQNTPLPLENVLASVAGIMCMVAVKELYPEAIRALPPPSRRGNNNLVDSYRPILSGTIVGMSLMIATELYLPS